MSVVVIADDVKFELDPALGAYRVQVIQRGECAAEVIICQSVLQKAIASAMEAIEAREQRPVNVVAFR